MLAILKQMSMADLTAMFWLVLVLLLSRRKTPFVFDFPLFDITRNGEVHRYGLGFTRAQFLAQHNLDRTYIGLGPRVFTISNRCLNNVSSAAS